jgi:hypothetical protein
MKKLLPFADFFQLINYIAHKGMILNEYYREKF